MIEQDPTKTESRKLNVVGQSFRESGLSWEGSKGAARLAEAAGSTPPILSLVLGQQRDLSLEQAMGISAYIGLGDSEKEYFFDLVQFARAGTSSLRRHFKAKIDSAQKRNQQLTHRLAYEEVASREVQAQFYSDWSYSAIRNLIAAGVQDIGEIGRQLGLGRLRTNEIVDFLIKHGFCKREEGKLVIGIRRTHIGQNSPWAANHHRNWRLQHLNRMSETKEDHEVSVTFPMTISKKDIKKIKKLIVDFVSSLDPIVEESQCEACACLSIDWRSFYGMDDPEGAI